MRCAFVCAAANALTWIWCDLAGDIADQCRALALGADDLPCVSAPVTRDSGRVLEPPAPRAAASHPATPSVVIHRSSLLCRAGHFGPHPQRQPPSPPLFRSHGAATPLPRPGTPDSPLPRRLIRSPRRALHPTHPLTCAFAIGGLGMQTGLPTSLVFRGALLAVWALAGNQCKTCRGKIHRIGRLSRTDRRTCHGRSNGAVRSWTRDVPVYTSGCCK